jgi:hypothetical protein
MERHYSRSQVTTIEETPEVVQPPAAITAIVWRGATAGQDTTLSFRAQNGYNDNPWIRIDHILHTGGTDRDRQQISFIQLDAFVGLHAELARFIQEVCAHPDNNGTVVKGGRHNDEAVLVQKGKGLSSWT